MSSRRSIYSFLAAALLFVMLLSYVVCRAFLPFHPRVREWNMSGSWIAPSGDAAYAGYFRKSFFLPANVRNAWIAVSACDVYEVIVNSQEVGSQTIWPPNFPFQYTTTEKGQRLQQFDAGYSFPLPRDYQWESEANYELPVFFDLTPFLKPGNNCVCVRASTRKAPAKLCVEGMALLTTGESLSLDSGPDWKADSIPRTDVAASWTDARYNDLAWPAAVDAPCPGPTYCTFAPEIFSEPFRGKWIVPPDANTQRSVWFVAKWNITGRPDEAWVRLSTNRYYALYINGRKAEPPVLGPNELGTGDWIVHTRNAVGAEVRPEWTDPTDDTSPLTPEATPDYLRAGPSETAGPVSLLRDRQVDTFDAYGVGPMLREGENEIAVRLIQPGPWLKWAPRLALDATAISTQGRSTLQTNGADWTVEAQRDGGGTPAPKAVERGPAMKGIGPIMPLRYLGYCYPIGGKLWEWTLLCGTILLAFAGILLWIVNRRVPLLEGARGKRELSGGESRYLAAGTAILTLAAMVLACTMVADASFAPRTEALLFMTGLPWLISIAACGMMALLAGLLLKVASPPPRLPAFVRRHAFKALLCLILILCAFLRVYQLQFQPSGPDEWASTQAILSIADKGVPMLTEDVFYTRSALYHYLVGGLVALFGRSLWVLKLPSVVFAVATTALIYETGKRLLHSRWTGLGAATLLSLHPLLIDIGHQTRFYQQQQFFALLTVYCFCRGFVEEQRMKWRYLTAAALFAAVFSQEISVLIGITLLPSYFLFAERKSWPQEVRFLVLLACGMVFVALDLALWHTVCLSVHAGVSPQLEPELKLNLMYASTFYWFFFLPSRLHFASSFFLFIGLPFNWRERNKSLLVLFITFLGGIVLTTIFITGSALRFQYWLIPYYFLLLVHGMIKLAEWVMQPAAVWFHDREPAMRAILVCMALGTVLIAWSPWKIPGSYSTKVTVDIDEALAFVSHNILPKDALAVEVPDTTAALLEVGRVDYDIEMPLLYDFVYRKNGELRDRNAGAEVISSVDDLQQACGRHSRLWVVLTRDIHFRSPGELIAWDEPGARANLFIRTNCELKYQSYLVDVYLWDYSKGRLKDFRGAW